MSAKKFCKNCGKEVKPLVKKQAIAYGKRRGLPKLPYRILPDYCSQKCRKERRGRFIYERSKLTKEIRAAIFQRDRRRCRYCGSQAEVIDHIVPVCAGGKTERDNLAACCFDCNATASGKTFENFSAKKSYILNTRRVKEKTLQHDTFKERPRAVLTWRSRVYGGIKTKLAISDRR